MRASWQYRTWTVLSAGNELRRENVDNIDKGLPYCRARNRAGNALTGEKDVKFEE
jgi:hypothetical protein